MSPQRRRILILTSDTGAGHRSVSNALAAAALDAPERGLDTVQVDPLAPLPSELRHPEAPEDVSLLDRIVPLYGPIIVRFPWLWGWAFRSADSEFASAAYRKVFSGPMVQRIMQAIVQVDAQAVVSVHPLVNHAMVEARRRLGHAGLPLLTIVTDLVDVHQLWACSEVDQYVVGSGAAASRLLDLGIAPQRIAVSGIPIRREFGSMAATAREMRLKLELQPDVPVLLLMGGGDGAGRLVETAKALDRSAMQRNLKVQLVVVTGRNVGARMALEGHNWAISARVLGFTSNIAEYMTAADIVATKPGSATVSEGLTLGRPLLLGKPLPGQEEGNIGYVVGAGAGLAYTSPAEAADAIVYLLGDPAARWEMGQRAARLSHPRATERTLDLLAATLMRTASRPKRAENSESSRHQW